MAKRKGRLSFREIDAFDARGLARGPVPGVGVHIGRRSAVADLWIGRDGTPHVRFRTSHDRQCFVVTARGGQVSAGDWSDALSDRLADWLVDAINDDLD